jgi:signal transduction histidine kinase
MTWKLDRESRQLESQDFDDLKVLAGPDVRHRELHLDWDVQLDGPADFPASEVRQIVLNLLLNACRASEIGNRVTLRVGVTANALVIHIGDSGPGMPDFAVRTLTNPSSAPSPFASGHGLGLWTTRRLVSEMGGSIAVGTNGDKGAAVTVTLPKAISGELRDAA